MVETNPVQFVQLDKLSSTERTKVQTLTADYLKKIKRATRDIISLKVHIKTHGPPEPGKKRKFTAHIRLIGPNIQAESSKSTDWDLAVVCHKAYKDILRELEKKAR